MNKKVSLCLLVTLAIVVLLQLPLFSHRGLLKHVFAEGVAKAPVIIAPDFELDGTGLDVDSIAFWDAASPNNTLMFVTAKANSLVEVWQFPFTNTPQITLTHSTFGSSPVNGVAVDQEMDLLYVSVGRPASTVSVFSVPSLTFTQEFISGSVNLLNEPNMALLNHTNGDRWLYVSADNIVYIHHAKTGEKLAEFEPPWDVETIVVDNSRQLVYIPDENDHNGVFAYNPDGSPYLQDGTNNFGSGGIFDEDAEGIIIYACYAGEIDKGSGFIVVADQKSGSLSDFEFFDRQSWAHLGALQIAGVTNSDGVGSTQQALNDYPLGILAVINSDTTAVGVGWDKVLEAMELSCPPPPLAVTIQAFNAFKPSMRLTFVVSALFLMAVTTIMRAKRKKSCLSDGD